MSCWFPSGKIGLDGVNRRLRSILETKLVNDTHYGVLHRPMLAFKLSAIVL